MTAKVGSSKISNFWGRVLVLGRGHISHMVKKSSYLLPGIDQTNLLYNIDNKGRIYPNYKFDDLSI